LVADFGRRIRTRHRCRRSSTGLGLRSEEQDAGDVDPPAGLRPLARLDRESDRPGVQLVGERAQARRLQDVACRRERVHGDHVSSRPDVVLVDLPHRVGVVPQGHRAPRLLVHRHAQPLELRPDGAVEDEELAARQPLLEVRHVFPQSDLELRDDGDGGDDLYPGRRDRDVDAGSKRPRAEQPEDPSAIPVVRDTVVRVARNVAGENLAVTVVRDVVPLKDENTGIPVLWGVVDT
jgi:hypothetical protein